MCALSLPFIQISKENNIETLNNACDITPSDTVYPLQGTSDTSVCNNENEILDLLSD